MSKYLMGVPLCGSHPFLNSCAQPKGGNYSDWREYFVFIHIKFIYLLIYVVDWYFCEIFINILLPFYVQLWCCALGFGNDGHKFGHKRIKNLKSFFFSFIKKNYFSIIKVCATLKILGLFGERKSWIILWAVAFIYFAKIQFQSHSQNEFYDRYNLYFSRGYSKTFTIP